MISKDVVARTITFLLIPLIYFSCEKTFPGRHVGCTDSKALNYEPDAEKGETEHECSYSTTGFYLSSKLFNTDGGECNEIDSVFLYVENKLIGCIGNTIVYPAAPENCTSPGIIPYTLKKSSKTDYYLQLKGCLNGQDTLVYITGRMEPSEEDCIITEIK